MKNIVFEDKRPPITCAINSLLMPTPHFHSHIEVIYAIEGEANAYADRKKFHIDEGDIFFTFPNQIHYYETISMGKFLILIFSAELLFGVKDMLSDSIPKNNVLKLDNEMCHNLLLKILDNYGDFDLMHKAGLINQIFSLILPKIQLKPRIKTNNATLFEVINFCSENYSSDITLNDIAETLHISKFHISHLINNKLGISFSTYLNNLRIYHACELIEDTNKKITDISGEVGFGSIRTFNRAFKEVTNLTPNEYRNHFKV